MTATAGPHLGPPPDPHDVGRSRISTALGDAAAVAVVLVTIVCGVLGCSTGVLGLALFDGEEGAGEVVVGALLLAVALVAAVAEIWLLCGALHARALLAACAAAGAVLVAIGTQGLWTGGRGIAAAGMIAAAALGLAAVAILRMSTAVSRRPGPGAVLATVLVLAFVLVELAPVAEILFRLVVGVQPVAVALPGLALTALYVVLPLAGAIACLRGVRWAYVLVLVPCAAQALLMLPSIGGGPGALLIALAVATAAAALFLRSAARTGRKDPR